MNTGMKCNSGQADMRQRPPSAPGKRFRLIKRKTDKMHRWPLLLQGFVLSGCDTWYYCSHLVNMRTLLRTGYHNNEGKVEKWKGSGFETTGLKA